MKPAKTATSVLATLLTISAIAGVDAAAPSNAPVRPVTDDYFGTKVGDDYRYFEDAGNVEAQSWMKAEANYTRETLDDLPGYAPLLHRIAALGDSQAEQVNALEIVGGRYYTLRSPAGTESARLYVRDGLRGRDRLLVDPDKLAAGTKTHLTIHDYRPSPDGRYVAYDIAAGGSEQSVLHVLDVNVGHDLAEMADRALFAPSWRDGHSFFYLRLKPFAEGAPETERYANSRVYLHVLGHSFDEDKPVLGRGVSDAGVAMAPAEIALIATAPGSHYAIAFVSPGADERLRVYAAPIDSIRDGSTKWRPIAATYDEAFIGSDNSDEPAIALARDTLYWLSRNGTPRGAILKLGLAHADSKPETAVPEGSLPLSAVYAARDAIYWRENDAGVNSIHRLRLGADAKPQTLTLPYAGDVSDVAIDAGADGAVLTVSSWLRFRAYLGVDEGGAITDTVLQPAGSDDRPDDLVAEELNVPGADGTPIPLSIVHRKGMAKDGRHLALINGYGAYGISTTPFYLPAMRAWYERDGLIAFAHVRGGGELGEAWHKAGQQATKPNTWNDFIACAQYLVEHGYTNPARLVGLGQSAGGIMIGRAIEERPDLFTVAIIRVPAADMLRFETTANGPDNIAEFGSVKTEAGFDALRRMSPYANVIDGTRFPATIIYAGANDPRVPAWIPAKLAARMQAATASGKPVLLRVDYDAGHTGFDATRTQTERNTADMLAFALWQTGDADFQPH